MSPHFHSSHDAVTMGSFIIILIAVTAYCSETHGDISPIVTRNPKDIELRTTEKGNNDVIEKGNLFWKNFALSRNKSTSIEESMNPVRAYNDTTKRKSRLLGLLAGLSFGNFANAASSTVKTFSSLPQASFTLNFGSSSRNSPYFTAYYNPYSLLPYSFLYPGAFGFVPSFDPAKPQMPSNNALIPQVISLFDNRQPIDPVQNNEEYIEEKKKSDHNKRMDGSKDEADRRAELRIGADRNAEEKTKIDGCRESQRKHGSKESLKEHENRKEDADDSGPTLNFEATNMTDMDTNDTRKYHHHHHHYKHTTPSPNITSPLPTLNTTHHIGNYTEYPPFSGYFGGYPQDINHIELKPDSDTYQYHDYNQFNHNLPYEKPASFYHDNKYNTNSSPYINPYFSGQFLSDQTNEYVGTDFNRLYTPEYQAPYANGFRPLK